MPQYFFRDGDGTIRRLAALDMADAAARASKLLGARWRLAAACRPTAISATEKMWLWRQLAAALEDRLPLQGALVRISRAAATGPARVAAARLAGLCAEGLSLSEALAATPGIADAEQVALVRAAERARRLAAGVRALADLAEADADTSAELSARWMYPAAVAFFGLFVLPIFATVVGTTLHPTAGRLWKELGVTGFLAGWRGALWTALTYVPLVVLVVALATVGALAVAAAFGWRPGRVCDRLLYLFPGYGAFRFHRRLTIFFRALALGAGAGLPDGEALAMARAAVGPAVSMGLLAAQGAVEAGQPLAEALAAAEVLPAATRSRLVAARPDTFGATAEALAREHRRMADYYARRFVTLVEPAMVVLVALAVGLVATASFGPMVHIIELLAALTG